MPLPNSDNKSTSDFGEGFDDITTLTGNDWVFVNNSAPLGIVDWFQGNTAVFIAYDGIVEAYIGVNFNSVGGTNTISNWMFRDQGVFLGESNRIDSILLITNDMVDALKKHDIKVFLLHFFEKV